MHFHVCSFITPITHSDRHVIHLRCETANFLLSFPRQPPLNGVICLLSTQFEVVVTKTRCGRVLLSCTAEQITICWSSCSFWPNQSRDFTWDPSVPNCLSLSPAFSPTWFLIFHRKKVSVNALTQDSFLLKPVAWSSMYRISLVSVNYQNWRTRFSKARSLFSVFIFSVFYKSLQGSSTIHPPHLQILFPYLRKILRIRILSSVPVSLHILRFYTLSVLFVSVSVSKVLPELDKCK